MAWNMADVENRRTKEVEAQFNEFQKWTVKVSSILNDLQLQQAGLSPLQKQFGHVMGPPGMQRKRRTRDGCSRVKPKGNAERVSPVE
jgi:hypothetical protein